MYSFSAVQVFSKEIIFLVLLLLCGSIVYTTVKINPQVVVSGDEVVTMNRKMPVRILTIKTVHGPWLVCSGFYIWLTFRSYPAASACWVC